MQLSPIIIGTMISSSLTKRRIRRGLYLTGALLIMGVIIWEGGKDSGVVQDVEIIDGPRSPGVRSLRGE